MKQQSKKLKIQSKDRKAKQGNGVKKQQRSASKSQNKKWQPPSGQKQAKEQSSNTQLKSAQLENLPTIQDILQMPQADRSKKIPQLFKKIKPFLQNYMIKKQGSRVLQLMLKWGTPQIRHQVNNIVKKNWKDLLKSKYAIHVIGKLAKEKDCQLDDLLINDCFLIQQTKQSALILQNYLKRNIQSQNSKKIIAKFSELAIKSKQKNQKAQEMLQNLTVKSIEKEYYLFHISKMIIRMALPILFEQQKQNVVQFLSERVAELVCDEEGIRLFITLYNYCSAKQKKTIVKAYKGYVHEVLQNNNVSYVSIIKIILDTDDTVLIGNSLLNEVIDLFPLLIQDQHNQVAKRLFMTVFSIFSPRNHNFNVLSKYEHENVVNTCKKSENDRRKQLRAYLYEQLLAFLTQQNIEKICRQPTQSKLIIGIVRAMFEDKQPTIDQFLQKIVNLFLNSLKNKKQPIQNTLIADANAHKVLKNILLLNQGQIDKFCDKVANSLLLQLQAILKTKCSYVLLGLIQKGNRDWILDEIKKRGISLQKDVVAGEHFKKLLKGNSQVPKANNKTNQKPSNSKQKNHENSVQNTKNNISKSAKKMK